MIKSKKPFVNKPGYEHPESKYFSRSLDSMLESISIFNSSISDQNSDLGLSDQFSDDDFDIMDNNYDIENSVLEKNEENTKNLIFTFLCLLLFHIFCDNF
ncbi:741_t:CDS:2 [Diversispora eburnea]|uniref:741_t:CDS:1 n=1 Tax=Diversispora eburnea TaxID=1213867 RepID=A0A9N9BXA1_9GLOM|nr:741_t:CDS:2 [Diversispora eburnea]